MADSALAYLAECEGIDKVVTLDRRDFPVYPLAAGPSLQLIPAR